MGSLFSCLKATNDVPTIASNINDNNCCDHIHLYCCIAVRTNKKCNSNSDLVNSIKR